MTRPKTTRPAPRRAPKTAPAAPTSLRAAGAATALARRAVVEAPRNGAARKPSAPSGGTLVSGSRTLALMARAFDRSFREALPPEREKPVKLNTAIRYAALSPGKRLRPLLVLSACEAVGGEWEHALPAAIALECAHAFSLVHDDLPAMDDDDYRRGRLTTHKKFGEAIGVLAGDALLALAFESLTGLTETGVSSERVVGSVGILSAACGSRELIGGQALDLEAEGRKLTGPEVRNIHVRKTGGLMGAALAIGALVGGAAAERVESFDQMGRDLGVAFQIHDDLMNRDSSLEKLGKRAGTDDARGKATYPRAVGEHRAHQEAGTLFLRVLDEVDQLGPPAWTLGHLILAVAEREK